MYRKCIEEKNRKIGKEYKKNQTATSDIKLHIVGLDLPTPNSAIRKVVKDILISILLRQNRVSNAINTLLVSELYGYSCIINLRLVHN